MVYAAVRVQATVRGRRARHAMLAAMPAETILMLQRVASAAGQGASEEESAWREAAARNEAEMARIEAPRARACTTAAAASARGAAGRAAAAAHKLVVLEEKRSAWLASFVASGAYARAAALAVDEGEVAAVEGRAAAAVQAVARGRRRRAEVAEGKRRVWFDHFVDAGHLHWAAQVAVTEGETAKVEHAATTRVQAAAAAEAAAAAKACLLYTSPSPRD